MDTEGRIGRPRSERARTAVLHAVDDLLVEVGYAAMTMKGIAEAAGVGRQTVYRWWSTKAEILAEACVRDAAKELAVPATGDVRGFLGALADFLTTSPAGIGYRALLGEAQHDPAVMALVRDADILGASARAVLTGLAGVTDDPDDPPDDLLVDRLVGPLVVRVLRGETPSTTGLDALAAAFARSLG